MEVNGILEQGVDFVRVKCFGQGQAGSLAIPACSNCLYKEEVAFCERMGARQATACACWEEDLMGMDSFSY